MAEEICSRMARIGRSIPAISVMVSRRDSVSRGLLEWAVVIEPSWPVFMACSMSRRFESRISPTMIRSGRMRSALTTRFWMVTSPRPSMFGGRDSSVTTCSWRSWSSAAFSMVMMRSSPGMNCDSTLRKVVLPEPVPPEITMLRRASTQAFRNSTASGVIVPYSTSCSTVIGILANFRMVSIGPTREMGGMTAFTREPSGRRASTYGLDSSMRRPSGATMRSMMRITWSSLSKLTGTRWILPLRSM